MFLSLIIGLLVTFVVTRAAKVDFNNDVPAIITQGNKLRFYAAIFLAISLWAYVLMRVFTSLMTNYYG
nr:hypothetical protein [Candidatus Njordarchaeota archaeon]